MSMIINISENTIREVVSEVIKRAAAKEEEDSLKNLVASTMKDIAEFLTDFNLKAKLLRNTYTEWVGQYRSRSVKTGTMKFSINLDIIREFGEELADDPYSDADIEMENQVMVSLWHECGHGLMEHIRYCRRRDTQKGSGIFKGQFLKDTRWLMGYVEEDIVEEFGEYMAGLRYDSDLFNYLIKYKNNLQYE